jgi:4-amino-4-deoxy-L-arabinose transferase-like glycosyltransferase
MVAWLMLPQVAGGYAQPFFLRLPFVLMGVGSAVCWWAIARRWASPAQARRTLLFVLFVPYLVVQGSTAVPDAAALFFLSLTVLALALDRPVLAGLALGAAGLSKLTAVLWLPGLLYLMRQDRRKMGLTLGVAGLVLLPFLGWNAAHDWAPVRFQAWSRHAIHTRPTGLLSYLGTQALVASPVLFFLAFRRRHDARLLLLGAVPLVFFGCFSTREAVEIYWPLMAWLPLAMAVAKDERRWVPPAVVAPGVAITLLLLVASLSPSVFSRTATGNGNDISELPAYPALAAVVRDFPGIVVTQHYGLSSALWYFSGRPTWTLPINLLGREFQVWQSDWQAEGQPGLYVDRHPLSEEPDVLAMLQASFRHVGATRTMRIPPAGPIERIFYLTPCDGFVGRFLR